MYKHILLPIDLDQPSASNKAVKTACQIATLNDSTLHFLTVVPPLGSFASSFFPDTFQAEAGAKAMDSLRSYTAGLPLENLRVQHMVSNGSIYDQILLFQKQSSADLIVMASHRPELSDYLLGPNAARVVRHAPCSVIVVRD